MTKLPSSMVKWLKSVWKEIAERSPAKDYSADVFIPYTPSSKRVLAFAKEEAKAIGLTQAGTEHVLLGLLRQSGVAGQILKRFGVDAEQVRQEILIGSHDSVCRPLICKRER